MRNYGQWMGGTTRQRTELRGRRDFVPLKRQVGGTRSCRELWQRDVPTANRAENMFPNTPATDGEEDDDDSDDDLQIVASSSGTEAPVKKAKMTLTEEQERFAKQFLPAVSKVVRTRKISVRHWLILTFQKRRW
jgi:hypothetical protein